MRAAHLAITVLALAALVAGGASAAAPPDLEDSARLNRAPSLPTSWAS